MKLDLPDSCHYYSSEVLLRRPYPQTLNLMSCRWFEHQKPIRKIRGEYELWLCDFMRCFKLWSVLLVR